jgi:hypothetical protein
VALELDHVFVCCAVGAPEADALIRAGFSEGSGNVHPGQGTANRRFFFHNAYLELIWVADEAEARNEVTAPTRLWERWSSRTSGFSPFGIVFRPVGTDAAAPFPTWSYRPGYLPPGLSIEFARDVPLEEPELLYMPFAGGRRAPASEPTTHRVPIEAISGLVVQSPAKPLSPAARTAQEAGLVTYRSAGQHVLELHCVGASEMSLDLRPALPLIVRTAVRY